MSDRMRSIAIALSASMTTASCSSFSLTAEIAPASYRPEGLLAMKQSDTGKTVYYVLDLDAPPRRMSAAERPTLDESPIDFSDLPEQTIDESWYMPNWPARFTARAASLEA